MELEIGGAANGANGAGAAAQGASSPGKGSSSPNSKKKKRSPGKSRKATALELALKASEDAMAEEQRIENAARHAYDSAQAFAKKSSPCSLNGMAVESSRQ